MAVTREQVRDGLDNGWGGYVERFRALPADVQAAFLSQQGYARLGDLLAHAAAWFAEGQKAIEALRREPGWTAPQYDVDAFNAEAVRRAAALDDDALAQHFEQQRQALAGLVASLPDERFNFKRINRRLEVEVLGHLDEHALPEKPA